MGNHASKKSHATSSNTITTWMNNTTSMNTTTELRAYEAELRSYEAACQADTELQSFDTSMQARTSHVIRTLATGVEVQALSFDSFKEVTACLLEMNQDAVKVILDSQEDIWKNQELFKLVEDHFETSSKTLEFCASLENGLRKARRSQLLIVGALEQFQDESLVQGGNGYKKTLEELKNFKDAESPFNEDVYNVFDAVFTQQMLMLEKLQHHKNKLDKKLKSIKKWRKLSSVIFMSTLATVFICTVVAAAINAPPVVAALAAAASALPLGSMGKWIDSLWKNYEKELKGQRDVISLMQTRTTVTIKELESIRDSVERLEIELKGLVEGAEFAVEHKSVRIGIDEIKKKLDVFRKNAEKLGSQARVCSKDIISGRTVILERLMTDPSST